MDIYPNYAIFTNNIYIRDKRPFMTWYDEFCNGKGCRVDIACIDMSLPKNIILEVIIPCCINSKSVFIWDESLDNFKPTTISNILEMLNN